MEPVWPSVLINGAMVMVLWGLVWKGYHQRLDQIQIAVERRVAAEACRIRHDGLQEDVQEIKRNQEKMAEVLEEIRLRLARENGRRIAQEESA